MLPMVADHITQLEALCDNIDANIATLRSMIAVAGSIESDAEAEEQEERIDELFDATCAMWDELDRIVDGDVDLSEYERAISLATTAYEQVKEEAKIGRWDCENSRRTEYDAYLCLLGILFADGHGHDGPFQSHVDTWARAHATQETLCDQLYRGGLYRHQ